MLTLKSTIVTLVLSCLATTLSAAPATPSTILADLKTIDGDANTLNSECQSYTGSSSQVFAIQQSLTKFDNDIKAGYSDCQKEAAWSTSDCQTELNYVNNTLEPDVKAMLATLQSKKSTIASGGATGTVKSSLQTLKADMDNLLSCMSSKCPSSLSSQAAAMKSKIDTDFQNAINTFS